MVRCEQTTVSEIAQSGVTVFRVAFHQWLTDADGRSMLAVEADVMRQLGVTTAGAAEALPAG